MIINRYNILDINQDMLQGNTFGSPAVTSTKLPESNTLVLQGLRPTYSRVAYVYVRSRTKYLKFRTTTSKFNTLRKPLM